MRAIPSALQATLDASVTTLAQCWILTRRDGVVRGFTDHDRDLVIDGVVCRAGTGFGATEAASKFGLAIGGAEIAGALESAALTEADLAAGRYDATDVASWLVDWSDVSRKVLTARSTLGEVRRQGHAFTAELRGLADALAQESGRLYTSRCSADLGDGRCRIDLDDPAWRGVGAVTAVDATASVTVSGLSGFADGLFTEGRLTWSSGPNSGVAIEVKLHRAADGVVRLTLWQAMAEPIGIGDAFVVTAGCDKRFATCRDRFGNALNFRGFPQIPGNDFIVSYPLPGKPGAEPTKDLAV